jgi:hypothetical protein
LSCLVLFFFIFCPGVCCVFVVTSGGRAGGIARPCPAAAGGGRGCRATRTLPDGKPKSDIHTHMYIYSSIHTSALSLLARVRYETTEDIEKGRKVCNIYIHAGHTSGMSGWILTCLLYIHIYMYILKCKWMHVDGHT